MEKFDIRGFIIKNTLIAANIGDLEAKIGPYQFNFIEYHPSLRHSGKLVVMFQDTRVDPIVNVQYEYLEDLNIRQTQKESDTKIGFIKTKTIKTTFENPPVWREYLFPTTFNPRNKWLKDGKIVLDTGRLVLDIERSMNSFLGEIKASINRNTIFINSFGVRF